MPSLFRETEVVPTEPPEDRADEEDTDKWTTRDRGAGTVMSIGICLALLGAAVAGLLMVQATVAAVRAATAADLAALAGADALRGLGPLSGEAGTGAETGDGCAAARETAARNKARLTSCTADRGRGTVTVEAEVHIPALPAPATARARAGPPS